MLRVQIILTRDHCWRAVVQVCKYASMQVSKTTASGVGNCRKRIVNNEMGDDERGALPCYCVCVCVCVCMSVCACEHGCVGVSG